MHLVNFLESLLLADVASDPHGAPVSPLPACLGARGGVGRC